MGGARDRGGAGGSGHGLTGDGKHVIWVCDPFRFARCRSIFNLCGGVEPGLWSRGAGLQPRATSYTLPRASHAPIPRLPSLVDGDVSGLVDEGGARRMDAQRAKPHHRLQGTLRACVSL